MGAVGRVKGRGEVSRDGLADDLSVARSDVVLKVVDNRLAQGLWELVQQAVESHCVLHVHIFDNQGLEGGLEKVAETKRDGSVRNLDQQKQPGRPFLLDITHPRVHVLDHTTQHIAPHSVHRNLYPARIPGREEEPRSGLGVHNLEVRSPVWFGLLGLLLLRVGGKEFPERRGSDSQDERVGENGLGLENGPRRVGSQGGRGWSRG